MAVEAKRCVGCRHPRHRRICTVALPKWRVWLTGLQLCSCEYWDARWDEFADD